jgi:fluoride exporter
VATSLLTVAPIVQDSSVPRPDRQEIAAIAAGGAVGALLRVALARSYATGAGSWPWITFAVNLAGAFLLGYFVTRLQERLPLSAYRRPLLGTGFCGALTTFSTMQLELLRMLDRHHYGLAVAYAVVSLVAGYACVHLATAVVRRVRVVA